MAFHVIHAMTDGFERTVARNGLVFVAIFAGLALLNALFTPASTGPTSSAAAPTIGPGGVIGGLLSIAVGLATVVVAIAAIRTFVSDETETIPSTFVRRNAGLATLNVLVGAVVFGLLVAIGSVLLLVPGLFVLVSLYYWSVYVAVEDQNFLEAFRSSWTLTRGSRLRLFALGAAVVVVGLAANVAIALPVAVLGGIVGFVLAQAVAATVTVYALATTARAYDQLTALEPPVEIDSQPNVPGTPA